MVRMSDMIKLEKKKIPKSIPAEFWVSAGIYRNASEWLGILSEVEQGPERNRIHNIALDFFYMISTTNVVCMKSKLREVVVSTKLTLLKVLAQRFINIGSRIKGTSAPWFCTQRKDFLDFLWYGLLRLKVIVHGVCKSKTSKSHLSSRSHITYLEISLEQTSKESQENSLLCLIPYSSVSKVCLSKTCSCAILQATLHSEYHLT